MSVSQGSLACSWYLRDCVLVRAFEGLTSCLSAVSLSMIQQVDR